MTVSLARGFRHAMNGVIARQNYCTREAEPCNTGNCCSESEDQCVAYGDGDFDDDVNLADFAKFQFVLKALI